MLILKDTDAIEAVSDRIVKQLLTNRSEQILDDTDHDYKLEELARFVIVQPFDTVDQIEAAAGYPVVTSPAFEWVIDHGGWYEATMILSDDGFGVILFAPEKAGVEPTLLQLLRDLARPAAA